MDRQFLQDLARYETWADTEHWKIFDANPKLLEDPGIRKILNHMVATSEMLQTLARGEMPNIAAMKDRESVDELRTAMTAAAEQLVSALNSSDLDKIVDVPRGPKGPFQAPAGMILFQILMHSQQHRAQNASRMRELGAAAPITDFILWYALGRP